MVAELCQYRKQTELYTLKYEFMVFKLHLNF